MFALFLFPPPPPSSSFAPLEPPFSSSPLSFAFVEREDEENVRPFLSLVAETENKKEKKKTNKL